MKNTSTVVPQPNNIPYLIAVVTMMLIGFSVATLIVIFDQDSEAVTVFGLVFGFLTPTTLSLLAFMKSQETHLSVNSRLDAFIKNAELAARAEGRTEGRDSANQRTDELRKSNSE